MNPVSLNDLISQISIGLDAVEAELLGATPYHSKRVAAVCLAMGRQLGYDEPRLFTLAGCALFHDNALTQYILSEKPSSEQQLNLQSHCVLGEENCRHLPFPTPFFGFVKYHHEYADGSGVFHLHQGEYPQEAAIISLADQVDVRYRLQTLTAEGLQRVRSYIESTREYKYPAEVSDAALEIFSQELIESVRDNGIHHTLRRAIPEVVSNLSEKQLVGLSGLTARIVDYKSRFTQEHTTQIANKAWYMSGLYGYNPEARAMFYQAAALHDIGKLFIPTAILEKPGGLTEEEFRTIKAHVQYTWDILSPIRGFEQITVWAGNHHEKLDGRGYPHGKTAEELDFNSRLLACLDIYQAVREARPYHPVRSHEAAMKILFQMAAQGFVDEGICQDLDRYLKDLPEGKAPEPVI